MRGSKNVGRRNLKTPETRKAGECIIFCGAFSLMAITGKTHDQAKRSIRRANGWTKSKRVMGLRTTALLRTFRHCGYKTHTIIDDYHVKNKITMKEWINSRTAEQKNQCFLINITEHFVIINGNSFIDTYTGVPVKLDDAPHQRCKVVSVHRIK
jgi:hypothetical protein